MDSVSIVRDSSLSGTDIIGDLRLEWSVCCNVGRVRETNEDAALALPGRYLLADGMGGHESGELASEAALLTLAGIDTAGGLDATRVEFDGLLGDAQDRIGSIDAHSDRRAGTTATGAVLVSTGDGPQWLIVNIGDSRTYRYQNGTLNQLTRDHSQVQEFVDAGVLTPAQARVDPRRNVITRALGAGMVDPVADYFTTVALPGDVLLICSDGLTGELPDDEIADILASTDDAEQAAQTLVDAALAVGAHDNVTVIVVSVHESVSTVQMSAVSGSDADAGTSDAAVPDAAVPDAVVPDAAVPVGEADAAGETS
ncbi:PP2C family protein-serine/threonine phosphatase [Gordonia sp. NPDC003429]